MTETSTYTRSRIYDNLDRFTQFSDSPGLAWEIGYEPNGNRKLVRDATGMTTNYPYDNANRLSHVSVGSYGHVDYGYAVNGLVTNMTTRNGCVGDLIPLPPSFKSSKTGGPMTKFVWFRAL